MQEIQVKDINNNPTDRIPLSEAIFNSAASDSVVHAAVVSYLANQRQGTHATKTRGLVSGGGRKPWKQKKTGRARHGSTRSPIWRGGGTVFGPQPRDYSIKLPANMKKAALYRALSMKLADNEISVVDSISIEKPATKGIIKILDNMGFANKSILLVISERDENIILSLRNIPTAGVIMVNDLNAYLISVFDNVIFTKDALVKLQTNAASGAEVTE